MIEALIFDVFGTVVDWRTGVAREAARFFAERNIDLDPLVFADSWRGQYQPAMERIRDGGRGYVSLDMLHRENLDIMLTEFGLDADFDEQARVGLNRAWEKLPPWPDCVSGLKRLKSSFTIATCSNGSIALMVRLAKHGGLPWDAILGADIAKGYKPQPAVYLDSVAALGLQPEEVAMVAAHNGDLAHARANGLKTAFLPRPTEHGTGQTTDLRPEADWNFTARDMLDLAEILGA